MEPCTPACNSVNGGAAQAGRQRGGLFDARLWRGAAETVTRGGPFATRAAAVLRSWPCACSRDVLEVCCAVALIALCLCLCLLSLSLPRCGPGAGGADPDARAPGEADDGGGDAIFRRRCTSWPHSAVRVDKDQLVEVGVPREDEVELAVPHPLARVVPHRAARLLRPPRQDGRHVRRPHPAEGAREREAEQRHRRVPEHAEDKLAQPARLARAHQQVDVRLPPPRPVLVRSEQLAHAVARRDVVRVAGDATGVEAHDAQDAPVDERLLHDRTD
eukprot:4002257-Prymnesium_polylepis.2